MSTQCIRDFTHFSFICPFCIRDWLRSSLSSSNYSERTCSTHFWVVYLPFKAHTIWMTECHPGWQLRIQLTVSDGIRLRMDVYHKSWNMNLKKIHYFSGITISIFIGLHLFNHFYSLFGANAHIEQMNDLRIVYRTIVKKQY